MSIDRDYVLACALVALAEDPDPFVLRGGSALARVYWPDFRLSEDLDLVAVGGVPNLELRVRELVAYASTVSGLELSLTFERPRNGWSRSTIRWNDDRELLLDINLHEQVTMPAETRRLDLPYDSMRGRDFQVPTVALPEILGNKWFMIDDRSEPRDLFDVWWGLCNVGIPFAELARGHVAKFRYRPVRQTLSGAAKRMQPKWEERLAHQIRDLPPFHEVLACVEQRCREWERADRPIDPG